MLITQKAHYLPSPVSRLLSLPPLHLALSPSPSPAPAIASLSDLSEHCQIQLWPFQSTSAITSGICQIKTGGECNAKHSGPSRDHLFYAIRNLNVNTCQFDVNYYD